MTRRPLLLDLYAGAGGAAAGYHRAGFDVVGIDIAPQPRYPFPFIQADALLPPVGLRHFDAIHASPPCQRYSKARHTPGAAGREYPDLLPATLALLRTSGRPWVVENVPGAPMPWPVTLCGTMFGLPLRRHRLFSASFLLLAPANDCRHRPGDLTVFGRCVQVCGSRGAPYAARNGRTFYRPLRAGMADGGRAMGIGWMHSSELSEAVPPAYTEWVGLQLRAFLAAGGGP